MAIDPNIVLNFRPANIADSFNTGFQQGGNMALTAEKIKNERTKAANDAKNNVLDTKIKEQTVAQNEFNMMNNNQQALAKSLITGAAQLKPFVDSGDNSGIENAIQNRISQLNSLGIDSKESQGMLDQFRKNPDQFKKDVNSLVNQGYALKILEDPNEKTVDNNLKKAQTYYYNQRGVNTGYGGNGNGDGYSNKPIPTNALKLQNEDLEAVGMVNGINSDLRSLKGQIDNGKLKLGLGENLISSAKNYTGNSDENSRNFSSFRATLEKQRNDSLRLNKGVQTEGDAIRAWNEIFQNLNDSNLVSNRLGEIANINERAASIKKENINTLRRNYNVAPMNFDSYENLPAAVGSNKLPTNNNSNNNPAPARNSGGNSAGTGASYKGFSYTIK